ncbi:substrate-binding domain-containing protein [Oscillospiraceae bacterium MB08-C2-2]|nr:substrate-binding domain-containing protein [Oscillospiraceae bacterium MB08-C2-2]
MKRLSVIVLALLLLTASLAGCGSSGGAQSSGASPAPSAAPAAPAPAANDFKTDSHINVVSREDGSGTRGAFIELFGIEKKNDKGEKVDYTTQEANITNSTSVMMTTVAGDKYAIGYISLGSLNDTVKALQIDATEATAANIKSGSYKISRPFNVAVSKKASSATADFISFILSDQGQAVVEKSGYISLDNAPAYSIGNPQGKIVVAGSSSVTPVMEKLKEAYAAVAPDVSIEIQQSDSTTGMTSAIDGICDIGMASRELKDSEIEKGLEPTTIAMDGIAVVVNKENPVESMTPEQVASIFTGETLKWAEILG